MPWLLKTEPESYSIDDLARDRRTRWDGVRNYQARNFMRDSMRVGDAVLVYHSSADPPCVVGTARVSAAAAPDATAMNLRDSHYDPKSTKENPIWVAVEIEFVERFVDPVPLAALRATKGLEKMALLQRGQRLSVQPVSQREFDVVCGLARTAPAPKPGAKRATGSKR
ncbi:MAG: EVE domain-containing protein [Phycisphaerales bacterium]